MSPAERRANVRAERILIDGRLVHPRAPHGNGTSNGYCNYACRCAPCSADWAKAVRLRKQRRASAGRMVEGRWFVPAAPHGTEGGYGNYGCRCRECTDVWVDATALRRARHAGVAA